MTISQIAAQLRLALAKRGVYVKLANRLDLVARMSVMPNPFAPPIVLDLDNKNHRFIIFDCTSWFSAYVKAQEIGATVIYTNAYGKVLAEKNP